MSFGSILKTLGGIGAGVAAPFTGGASLALIPALGAIGGALENTKGARTSTSDTTPTLAPEYQTLADLLRTRSLERLKGSMDMTGYGASGVANINDAYKGIDLSANNSLTSRGLATSPVAGTVDATLGAARGGDISQFLNTLPLLQRQFQNEDMLNAGNVLQFGRGTATKNVGAGSALGAGFSSAAELLAYLKGQQGDN